MTNVWPRDLRLNLTSSDSNFSAASPDPTGPQLSDAAHTNYIAQQYFGQVSSFPRQSGGSAHVATQRIPRSMSPSAQAADVRSEDGSAGFAEFGENIDSTTFEQILEMDDDEEEREFSRSIVYDFFTQAESTFEKMKENLEKKDLAQLSALGHFLKGSSATLGLTKVKDSCEKIQHFGANKDETGTKDEPDDEVCLSNCKTTIEQARLEFKDVEIALKKFYHDDGST